MSRLEVPEYSELGGFGGVIAAILGLMLIGVGVGIFSDGLMRYGAAIGGLLFLATGVVAIRSSIAERRASANIPALPDDYLTLMLAEQPLPYAVCVKCRQFDEEPAFHGRCPRCDAGADYLIVEHEAERILARSGLGIPE